jgi:hypothetical protein
LGLRDTTNLEKHGARTNNSNPSIHRTFTLTHTSFGWATSDGLVRENSDPGLTFTLEEAIDGNTASFDLAVRHPSAAEGLKSEVTETHIGATLGITTPITTV